VTVPELGPYGHVVPRRAATVALLRPGPEGLEVLLAHRPETMAFGPGLHVFPGGAVDAEDGSARLAARSAIGTAEAAARLSGVAPGEALASHIAAIRELFEEAGILLAGPRAAPGPGSRAGGAGRATGPSAGLDPPTLAAARRALVAGSTTFGDLAEALDLRLWTDRLVPLSRWVTPPVFPRRFDARFFAAELPAGLEASLEGDEVVAHQWIRPAAALDALADGAIRMWMPTTTNLERLEHARDIDEVRARLAPGTAGLPEVREVAPDILAVRQTAAAGVDGLEVVGYLVGGRELVAIDPGDPSEEALLVIVEAAAASGATVGLIALTCADPDHGGGVEHMREGLSLRVVGGPGAGRPFPFELQEVSNGERLPAGDVRVVAIGTPGPRPDHLAFHVPAHRAVLVGDLLGGPERAIPGPPDVEAWRRSLVRVDALDPLRLLPAHGDPVMGTEAVRRALDEAAGRLG
jgi:glyoxylase-like metal-dependent hydrolase (beta-lactamase superfamily II)/8-oxo-dGTP pyrophosphatase MutT (NUDIX family)